VIHAIGDGHSVAILGTTFDPYITIDRVAVQRRWVNLK
jgi:hypothetical protein